MRSPVIPCLGVGLAALALAACSDVSINSPARIFSSPVAATFGGSSGPIGPRPVTADDLVNQDGQCSGPDTTVAAAPAEDAPAPAAPNPAMETRGVGLEMTECQVVRRAGRPDRVEIGGDQGGQRAVVMTYLQGVRAGIYHFVNGRLKQVERAPEPLAPAKPPKPQKRAKPKTATAN